MIWYVRHSFVIHAINPTYAIPSGHPFKDTTKSLDFACSKFSIIKTKFVTIYPSKKHNLNVKYYYSNPIPPQLPPITKNIIVAKYGVKFPNAAKRAFPTHIIIIAPTTTGFRPQLSAKNPDKNAPTTAPAKLFY